jgi:hypothetical protein
MIAFVGPSSLTVSARDTVLVSKMGSILGIELRIKLGTELDRKCCTGEFPLIATFSERVTKVCDSPKFLKRLRIEITSL